MAEPSPLTPVVEHIKDLAEGPDTDARLLERIHARDGDAFRLLVEKYYPMALGVCRGVLRNQADAEDAVQETFIRFARTAQRLAPGTVLPGWLYRVAVNEAARIRRRSRRFHEVIAALFVARRIQANGRQQFGSDAAAPEWESWVPVIHLEAARLPDDERQAFVLCVVQGVQIQDAAAALGCNRDTVRARLSRATQRLRERLRRRGVEGPAESLTTGLKCTGPVVTALVSATVASAEPMLAQPPAGTLANWLRKTGEFVASIPPGRKWSLLVLVLGVSVTGAGVLWRFLTPASERPDSSPPIETAPVPTLAATPENERTDWVKLEREVMPKVLVSLEKIGGKIGKPYVIDQRQHGPWLELDFGWHAADGADGPGKRSPYYPYVTTKTRVGFRYNPDNAAARDDVHMYVDEKGDGRWLFKDMEGPIYFLWFGRKVRFSIPEVIEIRDAMRTLQPRQPTQPRER